MTVVCSIPPDYSPALPPELSRHFWITLPKIFPHGKPNRSIYMKIIVKSALELQAMIVCKIIRRVKNNKHFSL